MKRKFKALNFEGVEVLSREEKSKVKGGYMTSGPPNSTICSFTCHYLTKPDEIVIAPVNSDPCPWYSHSTERGKCNS